MQDFWGTQWVDLLPTSRYVGLSSDRSMLIDMFTQMMITSIFSCWVRRSDRSELPGCNVDVPVQVCDEYVARLSLLKNTLEAYEKAVS